MDGIISSKYRVLSGSELKFVALIAMIIDHVAYQEKYAGMVICEENVK